MSHKTFSLETTFFVYYVPENVKNSVYGLLTLTIGWFFTLHLYNKTHKYFPKRVRCPQHVVSSNFWTFGRQSVSIMSDASLVGIGAT